MAANSRGCSIDTVREAIVRLRAAGLLHWSNRWRWNERVGRVTKSSNHYVLSCPIHKTENPAAPPEREERRKGAAQVMAPALVKNRGNDTTTDRNLAEVHLTELAQRANEPMTASPELVEKVGQWPIGDRASLPDEPFPRLSTEAQTLVARQRR